MTKAQVLHKLHEVGLVPVLRAESVEEAVGLASVIAAGGVTVLEIMMTVSGAIDVIRQLKKDLPHVMIGAGTVRYQELDLYLRQSHAERDLHTLGELERIPVCSTTTETVIGFEAVLKPLRGSCRLLQHQ